MKFDDYRLSPEIKKNLADLGFKRPTDIQYKAIPSILNGEDVMAIAQTGTGKTAAFAIPLIHQIQQKKSSRRSSGVRALVMVPTRELAQQITQVFNQIGKHTKVKTVSLMGGVDQDPQIRALVQGVDIVVATPGRLFDLIAQGYLPLDFVDTLVLDEADRMLMLGFFDDIQAVLRKMGTKRQTLFFSATLNEEIKKMAYLVVRNALRIQIAPSQRINKNIHHVVTQVEQDDKRFFLERLIKEYPEGKGIVFVRTKVRAERVKAALQRVGIQSETIHGDKIQKERFDVLQQFRAGKVALLIATDVSARGIDLPGVDYVVNYDVPEETENYIHRIGRTGRGMAKGRAYTFCSTDEKPLLKAIEEYLQQPIEVLNIDSTTYQETVLFSEDPTRTYDWKALIAEQDQIKPKKKRK